MIRFFGDLDDVEILVFETKVKRAIEMDFNENVVSRTDADGLILCELEELIFEAKREIIGDDARGPEGEDLVEVLGF